MIEDLIVKVIQFNFKYTSIQIILNKLALIFKIFVHLHCLYSTLLLQNLQLTVS